MDHKALSAHQAMLGTEVSRRRLLQLAALSVAGTALTGAPAHAAPPADKHTYRLTVLGTTDTHGNVFNWDYFKDAEYTDSANNDIGLAKISTLVAAMREERGAENCLLLDAGDTIQGTPLSYYYAKIDPITGGHVHPMAAAMNAIGYDAAAMGNHEFNYGLDVLDTFDRQLNFPLLCANAVDWHTDEPVYQPYSLHTVNPEGGRKITVGVLGLVTPGVAIWDKAVVDGKVRFPGIVEQAKVFVPQMRAAGADIVIVSCHSGPNTSSSYGDALPYPENASTLLAEEVPGIDAILVGHAHLEIPQRFVTNKQTGKQVLLSEPLRWGMRLTVMDLDLVKVRGRWQVAAMGAHLLNANTVPEDPAIAAILTGDHATVRRYVNSVIGTSAAAMSAATARYEDTAAMDFVNHVQSAEVARALAGTPEAALPILSISAPFNKDATVPAGAVTVRDVAGMYIFDNTLLGIVLTGEQVRAYLEFSARYFKQVTGAGPFAPADVTNAVTDTAPNGTPDYNYDTMAGYTERLTYDIDIAHPVGARIKNLRYGDDLIDPAQRFVIAINNYRQSGGGNFPGVTTAPVVYNAQREIRQLIIDWVSEQGQIDPSSFSTTDWKLTANDVPVVIQA
ncbi:2',3'-cyclic-nucleotide 2'-phosphodiesterase/3'-nucleotidase [Georgenia soli]|uniref:2',3'-cyclic-nucleotide 2'-phosphodiesterase/3'-nucleotidase n=1 Tax=Georgenia soli TaxID=638953 RepID=A0A2A9EL56_9MICO|nr:5'-nucleotidase C-terminal domain-containing protein [Georgenia soli]PFG38992.1 2',3'-cyclic-nucleotide 2'-phosphodiesterase/3'-nucleotidase [Georgenia soli]